MKWLEELDKKPFIKKIGIILAAIIILLWLFSFIYGLFTEGLGSILKSGSWGRYTDFYRD